MNVRICLVQGPTVGVVGRPDLVGWTTCAAVSTLARKGAKGFVSVPAGASRSFAKGDLEKIHRCFVQYENRQEDREHLYLQGGSSDGHRRPMIEHLRQREKALEQFGWTGREAEWIALVCLHSGVFTRAQFCHYFEARRNAAHRIVRTLIERR